MSGIQTDDDHVPGQLVEQLMKGYDSLTNEFKRLHEQHRELENKLSWAKQQYLDALKRFTPASASKEFHDFLGELDEAGACQKDGDTDWLAHLSKSGDESRRSRAYNIQRAEDARTKISYRRKSTDITGVRIWAGTSADQPETMEQDFTTPGTPGRLSCPFASGRIPSNGHRGSSTPRSSISKVSLGRRSKRQSFHDPIKAELCPSNPQPSEAVSVDGSMPLCPIRFLDQHSPEEVARYFEKHKHELPRSHEVCVKRFQENEDALKNLDSKYANIVSMVKDLGQMHQPMLPKAEDVVDGEEDEIDSASKVERWAQDVSGSKDEQPEDIPDDSEEREQRFDRPLKDVRVGESPSRPWGITVPDEFESKDFSKKRDPTASPLEPDSGIGSSGAIPPMRCPFSGMKAETKEEIPHTITTTAPIDHITTPPTIPTNQAPSVDQVTSHNQQPQMVFNGPVFFGYPFDQAMNVLKQSGFSM